jgi:hypothetical protein
MLELAPTYGQAQLIADSPVKYYAHDEREPNHCREALEQLFYELRQEKYTLVFEEQNDRGGMDFYQFTPATARHLSAFEWLVPHLMRPEGGRTNKGQGHWSKKCDDAVAKACYGVIEFDWKADTGNPILKAFLDRLDAAGIAWKDAQAAIIKHLCKWGRLVAVVDSGGKSLHAWFDIRAVSREDWLKFRRYAVSMGSDPGGNTLSQQFRVPDGYRANGARQRILYFNPSNINPQSVG